MFKCNGCKTEITKGKAEKSGLCKKCWRKEHDKKNKIKLQKQAKIRRIKGGNKWINQTREWRKNNPNHYKTRNRDTSPEGKIMNAIRWKTIGQFKHLKENGCCEKCGSRINLEFHHLEPYAYDNFRILCLKCHRALHTKILIEMDDTNADKNVPEKLNVAPAIYKGCGERNGFEICGKKYLCLECQQADKSVTEGEDGE